jgi:osmotically-inducible protein OsmY
MVKCKKILISGIVVASLLNICGCAPVIVAGGAAAAVGANVAGNNAGAKVQLTDTQIKFRAIGILKDYPELRNNSNIEVTVYNHIVLILGQVPNANIKVDYAKKIADIPSVRLVYNQLQVTPTISFAQYGGDTWITTKVISSFLANGISSLKFKVVTEHGVVYLLGVVTRSEGNKAANIASKVSGVKKVVQVLSFIPEKKPATSNSENNEKAIGPN